MEEERERVLRERGNNETEKLEKGNHYLDGYVCSKNGPSRF